MKPIRLCIFLLCFALFCLSCLRARPVYIDEDKKTAEAAVKVFIDRYNSQENEVIYDDASDVFKNANRKENVLPVMKATYDQNGKILEVTDKLIKVVPGASIQVRTIYNVKCEKGERSFWLIYITGIDGMAKLAQVQPFASYTDLSQYKSDDMK